MKKSTVVETVLKDRTELKLIPTQEKTPTCFTETSSALHSAFTVTQSSEQFTWYKELLKQLFLLTFIAQKAFDKLNHELLFNKLHIFHDDNNGSWLIYTLAKFVP